MATQNLGMVKQQPMLSKMTIPEIKSKRDGAIGALPLFNGRHRDEKTALAGLPLYLDLAEVIACQNPFNNI